MSLSRSASTKVPFTKRLNCGEDVFPYNPEVTGLSFMPSLALRSRHHPPHRLYDEAEILPNSLTWSVVPIASANDVARLERTLDSIDRADTGVSLFQTSGWLAASANAVLANSHAEVRMLLAKRGEMAVAALPFSVRSIFGLKIATPLGHPLAQYSEILMEDAAYRQLGPDELRKAFALVLDIDAFCFRRVRDDAKIVGLMRDLGGEKCWRSKAPFADLTRFPDFQAFLKGQWKAHRNRSRLRRRADKDKSLTFEIAASSSRAVELARSAIELKRRWLRSKLRLFGTLSSSEWCEALAKAVEYPASSTQPVVTALHIHGRLAAIEVGFVRHRHYYAFLGAYEPELKRLSPTELLMEDTIRWCFAHGVKCYDLLPPDDAYKLKWTNDAMGVSDWIVCRSFAGRLYMKWRYRIFLPLAMRFVNVATRGHEWISRVRKAG